MSTPTAVDASSVRETGLEAVLQRDRLVLGASLALIGILAWAYTVYLAWDMQGSAESLAGCVCMGIAMPNPRAWGIADLSTLAAMWIVMMVAMMVPSAAPMVLIFAQVNRQRREAERPYVPTGLFLLGYLVVWSAFSVLATLAQWGLHAASLLSPMMESTSPVLAGALLIAAGAFQWTSWKHACLTHCRSPLSFILTDWRDGAGGALVMGIRHGTYCLVCCWALMGLLFAVGVMNLAWIAVLTIFVLVEKVTPQGKLVSRAAGVVLGAWGVWMAGSVLM